MGIETKNNKKIKEKPHVISSSVFISISINKTRLNNEQIID